MLCSVINSNLIRFKKGAVQQERDDAGVGGIAAGVLIPKMILFRVSVVWPEAVSSRDR